MTGESTPGDPPSASSSPGVQGLDCARCSHDLGDIPRGGVCPECGTPVGISLRGDLLKNASPEYLAALHSGVFWVQASIITSILLGFGYFLVVVAVRAISPGQISDASFRLYVTGLSLLPSVMSIGGWWLLTSPDPSTVLHPFASQSSKAPRAALGDGPRRLIRVALIVVACLSVFSYATAFLQPSDGLAKLLMPRQPGAPAPQLSSGELAFLIFQSILSLVSLVAWTTKFFASMEYFRCLAPRVPNVKIHTRATTLRWLGPLCYTVGLLLCGMGPLVALVLYYNLLDWIRADLKSIRERPSGGTGAIGAS